MKATIKINMDNDSFAGNPNAALATILRDLAKHIDNGETSRKIMDENGNSVGTFEITNYTTAQRVFHDGRWQTIRK